MKQEAARTRINRETQDVARKMNKVLRQERPRRRMESVTPRRLDVNCHFRLDQRENLAAKISAQSPPPRHTQNTRKKEAARTQIYREMQDVARKMNQLLRHERPRRRMESVTALWA